VAVDIMADSQTEAIIAALERGEADSTMHNRVSAAILRSQTKVYAQLEQIKDNLWTVDRLEGLVDRRHQALCAQCPARQPPPAPEQPAKPTFTEALLSSESIRYFILVVILVWAVIYVKTGPEGAASVREGLSHTVTGGAK
jgi:hypothetical protein